jgi:YD repeat-containing protein
MQQRFFSIIERYKLPCIMSACILFISGIQSSLKGQDVTSLNKIAPPSPEVAQLNKYINTPIGLSTGTISVNVPVYTIRTRNFQWPVSLSYHAGGIRIDEISSSVGLGWNLGGTGVVSRSIAGMADETGLLSNTVPYKVTDYNLLTTQQRWNLIQQIQAGTDSDPDKFSFNFNDKSGEFFLHRTKGTLLQSDNNVKVDFGTNPTITDDAGNTYYFTTTESGTSKNYAIVNGVNSGVTDVYDGITAWYLTRAVSYDKSDTIEFVYNGTYNIRQEQDVYSFNIGQAGLIVNDMCSIGLQQPDLKKTSNQVTSTTSPVLSEIRFKTGKVVFTYLQDRLDMSAAGAAAIGSQGRLTAISVYSKQGQTYSLFQKISLFQSYFTATVPTDKNPAFGYRLRLDSVKVFDKNNIALLAPFKFSYNTTVLPYRTSCAQDLWGYYNGADNNTTLTPNRIIEWNENGNSSVYNIGSASRSPDAVKMQACVLNKVIYPTGGFTVFEFEPHKFYDPNMTNYAPPATTPVTNTVTATPGTATHNPTLRFTVEGASQQVAVNAFFKAYYGKSDAPPYVKIKKVESTGLFSNVLTLQSGDATVDRNESANYNLIGGAQYELEAYVHAGSYPVNEVWSSITVTYAKTVSAGGTTTTPGIRMIGGLRIKTKTDYANNNAFALKETYSYGNNGEGVAISDTKMLNTPYTNVYDQAIYRPATQGSEISCVNCSRFHYRRYIDQSPYTAASLNGCPVGYSIVQKTQVDSLGNALGQELNYYNVLTDDLDMFPANGNYYPISQNWQNGKLWKEEVYAKEANGNMLLLKSTEHLYSNYRLDTLFNLIVTPLSASVCTDDINNYNVFQGRKYLGRRLPSQIITITQGRDSDGTIKSITDTVLYTYSTSAAHQNPITSKKKNSKKQAIDEYYYYPEDMISILGDNGGGIYTSMIQQGLTGPLVLKRQNNNSVQTKETKTVFASPFGTFIKPSSIYVKNSSNPSELRISMQYNGIGNITQQQKTNDVKEVYLWGYNQAYPVAKITGSDYATVLAKISQNILDNPASDQALRTELSKLNTISGAMVTMYTYDPLLGLTSETDPSGKTIYYEYDGFNRLKLIRDKDSNIIKRFDYQYQQQP